MMQEFNGLFGTEWQCVDLEEETNYSNYDVKSPFVAKRLNWLREYEGVGKYYIDPTFLLVYFECDEDMEMFLLRWA
jgi:hypothetical protein